MHRHTHSFISFSFVHASCSFFFSKNFMEVGRKRQSLSFASDCEIYKDICRFRFFLTQQLSMEAMVIYIRSFTSICGKPDLFPQWSVWSISCFNSTSNTISKSKVSVWTVDWTLHRESRRQKKLGASTNEGINQPRARTTKGRQQHLLIRMRYKQLIVGSSFVSCMYLLRALS